MILTLKYHMDDPMESRKAVLAVKSIDLALAIYDELERAKRVLKHSEDEDKVQKATTVFHTLNDILTEADCEFLHEPL